MNGLNRSYIANAIMDRMHTSNTRQCGAHESTAICRCSINQSLFAKVFRISLLALLPWFTTAWGATSTVDMTLTDTRISTHEQTGLLRFIGTEPGYPVRLKQSPRTEALEDLGLAFVKEYGSAFGIDNPSTQLTPLDNTPRSGLLNTKTPLGQMSTQSHSSRVQSSAPRTVGGSSLRYRQLHNNVPVFAGELVVNLDQNNALLSMNGEIASGLTVSVTPTVASVDAIGTALQAVAKWYNIDPAKLHASKPSLMVYDARLLKQSVMQPSLVWQMDVTSNEVTPIRELLLVDAHNGGINLHFNQIDTAKNRKTHDASGMPALPGTLVCSESDAFPGCAMNDADVMNAHAHAGDAYNFYWTTHGRDGIDNAGSVISSTVHYDDSSGTCPNAFWDGTQMVYCDGYADADDVVGHELTHGVTSNESSLLYYYESGAINESLSDIWGEFIDLSNATGNDSASARWLLGEDMPTGAIRDLQFPSDFGDPESMTSNLYWTAASDNGGVHSNSGVGNKAAYLMTDGDTFNGVTVTGLGVTKTAKIYYEAQANLLTSGSNYADLYDALYQACLNLVGTFDITADDCLEVRAATDAVAMNVNPPGFSPAAALCPTGEQQGTVLFSDNLESGSGNWSTEDLTGAPNFWALTNAYATSGTTSLWRPDPNFRSDSVIYNTAPVALAGDTYLHFRHSYSFETWLGQFYYDGGVVEYSTNGSTWQDLGALFDAGHDYHGTIHADYGNPLATRSGYVNESHGYVSSRFDLGTLTGQNFQVRFRLGSDESMAGPLGWVVDDVQIYSCGTPEVESSPQAPTCSGVDVTLENHDFTGDTTCTASSSLEAGTAVTVKTGTTVQFNSPITTLGPGFTIEQGSTFTILLN